MWGGSETERSAGASRRAELRTSTRLTTRGGEPGRSGGSTFWYRACVRKMARPRRVRKRPPAAAVEEEYATR